MKKIGFIGVGVMGKPMVRNLMKAGYEVSIYTRTKEKAEDVIAEGAKWCADVWECTVENEVIITMLGFPKDVEEVYFSSGGILENAQAGTYVIDMTTTSPRLAEKIYDYALEKRILALDAPVSGGDIGAQNATLSIMVGGDRPAFEDCKEIFECLGTKVIYEGRAGSGQHTKVANQIALAGAIAGVCEAIVYSECVGLDKKTMLDSISDGAASSWQMKNLGPKILNNDFKPGFFIKHYIKDMKIAEDEISDKHLILPVLRDVLKMYQELEIGGLEDEGTQALIKYYKL